MGPLAGYKIVEIKGIGPGPYAGMLLADLGADVIVIERAAPESGFAPPSEKDIFSRGKTRISLDLKSSEGLNALLTLVSNADAVFECFRPGVAERLGFGPDECLARNSKIVYGRMTGWGQDGPLSQSAGHDINYIALTGVLDAIGSHDKPVPPLNLVGDFAGGSLFLVTGMLAALLEVQKSGCGQVIDAAITDGSAHLMTLFYTLSGMGLWQPERESNMLDGGAPFYGVYQTSDARFVSVGALEPKFFAEMIEKTGLPERFISRQNSPDAWPELKAALTQAFLTKTRDEWEIVFEGSDACIAPVLSYEEAPDHPHNVARGAYTTVGGVTQPSPAPRFSRSQCDKPQESRSGHQSPTDVLARWGLSADDIRVLKHSGIFKPD